jgi:hypothetical protein
MMMGDQNKENENKENENKTDNLQNLKMHKPDFSGKVY